MGLISHISTMKPFSGRQGSTRLQMMASSAMGDLPDDSCTVKISGERNSSGLFKGGDGYMDKSVRFSPKQLAQSILEFFRRLKNVPILKNKSKFIRNLIFISVTLCLTGAKSAFAATAAPDQFSMIAGRSVFRDWAGEEMNKVAEGNAKGLLEYIKKGAIEKVSINPAASTADLFHADGHKMTISNFLATDSVIKMLMASGVELSVNWMQKEKQMARVLGGALGIFANLLFFVATLWATGFLRVNIFDKNERKKLNPFSFMKSEVEMVQNTNTKFDDVAGADEAKEELKEIVDFLKQP